MIRLISTFFCLLLPFTASAQCQGGDITTWLSEPDRTLLQTRAQATPNGHGLFWQAEKDGQLISILGTMHLPDPRHDAILNRVSDQLERADILLVEATLQDQTDMQIYMAENPDLLSITSGPTLPDLLDDATWQTLRSAAQSRGLPGFLAAKMQPWFLAMTLAIPQCAMGALVSGELGLDGMVMERAQVLGIPVAPLEPWQDMLALLTSGTQQEQLDALRMSALDPAVQDAILSTVIDAYFAGDVALVWHLNSFLDDFIPSISPDEYAVQMANLEQDLLVNRNRDWIPVIEDAARAHDTVFLAFGAAHLIDENGVLSLLEANGWTITAQ